MKESQKKIFLDREGDNWFSRNKIVDDMLEKKRCVDPVLKVLGRMGTAPRKVLEIGSSNGWRLGILKERWPGCDFSGIDPSEQAVVGAFPGISIIQGTADSLPYGDESFDMVLFGFCLYLCDRADLFRIAAEADRVLENGGLAVLYDFYSPVPYKNPYGHEQGVYSYKMDCSRLFSWNPSYRFLEQVVQPHPGYEDRDFPDNRIAVSILKKDMAEGWPDNPYKKE